MLQKILEIGSHLFLNVKWPFRTVAHDYTTHHLNTTTNATTATILHCASLITDNVTTIKLAKR
jgi:hypothetical protein